jgi:acetoin utilization deacetylase AcuC-like enzyme
MNIMTNEIKIGIIYDPDFALMHYPPFPKPAFIAFENPNRISTILQHLTHQKIFEKSAITKLSPVEINDNHLLLAHSEYHIDSIEKISQLGGGLIADEVFITETTFSVAKKAVGGAIKALTSFALIRPPGHHAMKDCASGLCIFNNIAIAIYYLRKNLDFRGKIAIIDIDDHFGDGLARYFYEDHSVLYFSIHEYDYDNIDIGLINELGAGKGMGKNINFPVPPGISGDDFMLLFEIVEPILREFQPELILVAAGFDMYFADPIGNCNLTSNTYYNFTQKILKISEDVCDGKLAFILEGGYSIIGLPYSILAVVKALLKEELVIPSFEMNVMKESLGNDVQKIKETLLKILSPYWESLNSEI